mgnify:CR=1 FL=1
MAAARRRPQELRELAGVLGTPGRIGVFLAISGVVTFLYTLLLPFDYTQRLELGNWHYLNAYLVAWAVLLGLAMGLVACIQIHAMRQIASARPVGGAASGVAFVASLLPSFLCCTPIIPSLLAFVGMSGVGLYTTTGVLQHFFAIHQTEFLAASLGLLVMMGWWGLRKLARSTCLADGGCTAGPMSAGVSSDGCGNEPQSMASDGPEDRLGAVGGASLAGERGAAEGRK